MIGGLKHATALEGAALALFRVKTATDSNDSVRFCCCCCYRSLEELRRQPVSVMRKICDYVGHHTDACMHVDFNSLLKRRRRRKRGKSHGCSCACVRDSSVINYLDSQVISTRDLKSRFSREAAGFRARRGPNYKTLPTLVRQLNW